MTRSVRLARMPRIVRRALRVAALTSLAVLGLLLPSCRRDAAPASTPTATAAPDVALQRYDFGGDFALGTPPQRFALEEHRGDVVLLFFGYTYCPDICPDTLSRVAQAQEQLGADRNRTFVVFVSVDPDRDTPARLDEYVQHFNVRGMGVTADARAIDAVVARYHAYYEKQPSASAMGYMVDHTSRIYLIDPQGAVRYMFRTSDTPSTIATGVRAALREAR